MNTVEICNLALNMLGMPAICELNEQSEQANLCRRFFPVCCQRVLRDHFWSFAAKTSKLQVLNEKSPLREWRYVCAVPADCLRIIGLAGDQPYRRFGKNILVNNPVDVIYVSNIDDPELFDVTFVEALQFLLASDLCMASTQNAQLSNFYRSEYQERLATARSIDSAENISAYERTIQRESTYLDSRSIGTNYAPGTGSPVVFVKGTEGIQGAGR
jgi:hypothetical protein